MKKVFFDRFKGRRHAGFTLTELMIGIGVLVVLFAVGTVGFFNIRQNFSQKTLDEKAQLIYVAAQNRLTQMIASGQAVDYNTAGESGRCYLVKGDGSGDAEDFLPADCLDGEVWNNQWAIEYDVSSGSVTAVYYSEGDEVLGYTVNARAALKQAHDEKSGTVGYCEGGTATEVEGSVETLQPTIEIVNGEVLKAVITCPETKISDVGVEFHITVYDSDDASKCETITVREFLGADWTAHSGYANGYVQTKHDNIGLTYSCELILDELTADGKKLFKTNFAGCTPGKNIIVRVEAVPTGTNKGKVDGYTVSAETNSLFSKVTDAGTAVITCGRHLQNLCKAYSGLSVTISAAEQTCDIDWDYYNSKSIGFTPIVNDDIQTYSGLLSSTETATVYNLTVNNTAVPGGLFGTFKGSKISDLKLCGTKITAGDAAGTLIGNYGGSSLRIENCRVYLDEDELADAGATSADVFISGVAAGGLIGSISSGAVNVTGSYAATVVGEAAASYAGGLVGQNAGTLNVKNSYADCYVKGKNAAGFVGSGNLAEISNSYCAGYVTSTIKGAGMATGSITKAENAYTIVCFTGCSGSTYGVATGVGSNSNLYYWAKGNVTSGNIGTQITRKTIGTVSSELKSFKDTAFRDVDYSVAYGLLGKAVSAYSFPTLTGFAGVNYGDWETNVAGWVKWLKTSVEDDIFQPNDTVTPKVYVKCSEIPTVTSGDNNVVTVSSLGALENYTGDVATEDTKCPVTLKFTGEGSTTVTAAVDSETDSLNVKVTAELKINEEKSTKSYVVVKGEKTEIKLTATGKKDDFDASDVTWIFTAGNKTADGLAEIVCEDGKYYFKGLSGGDDTIEVKAQVTKNGYTKQSAPITLKVKVVYSVTFVDGSNGSVINLEGKDTNGAYLTGPRTVKDGEAYNGQVIFNSGKKPDGDPVIAVYTDEGIKTVEYDDENKKDRYTWTVNKSNSQVYDLWIAGDQIKGNIVVTVVSKQASQYSVTLKDSGSLLKWTYWAYSDWGSAFMQSGNGAREYTIPNSDYIAYLNTNPICEKAGYHFTVYCNGTALKKDTDYTLVKCGSIANRYKLTINSGSITGDIVIRFTR